MNTIEKLMRDVRATWHNLVASMWDAAECYLRVAPAAKVDALESRVVRINHQMNEAFFGAEKQERLYNELRQSYEATLKARQLADRRYAEMLPKLQAEIDARDERLVRREKQIDQLTRTLSQLQEQVNNQSAFIARCQYQEDAHRQAQVEHLEAETEQLRAQLAQRDLHVNQPKQELDILTTENMRLRNVIAAKDKELTAALQEEDRFRAAYKRARAERGTGMTKINDLVSVVAEKDKDIGRLQFKLADYETQLDEIVASNGIGGLGDK